MSPPEGHPTTPPGKPTQQGNDPTGASPPANPTSTDPITSQGTQLLARQAQSLAAAPPTATSLTLLTINAHNAGANSPSLSDIVTMLYDHSPDINFLTETPPHTHSGALKHVLQNRDYCTHYHPSNAPSPPDLIPEARIPAHLTHTGSGSWLAYKKHASWSFMVQPLTLPADGPSTTPCAVGLTLLTSTKAAFIACYLPQPL